MKVILIKSMSIEIGRIFAFFFSIMVFTIMAFPQCVYADVDWGELAGKLIKSSGVDTSQGDAGNPAALLNQITRLQKENTRLQRDNHRMREENQHLQEESERVNENIRILWHAKKDALDQVKHLTAELQAHNAAFDKTQNGQEVTRQEHVTRQENDINDFQHEKTRLAHENALIDHSKSEVNQYPQPYQSSENPGHLMPIPVLQSVPKPVHMGIPEQPLPPGGESIPEATTVMAAVPLTAVEIGHIAAPSLVLATRFEALQQAYKILVHKVLMLPSLHVLEAKRSIFFEERRRLEYAFIMIGTEISTVLRQLISAPDSLLPGRHPEVIHTMAAQLSSALSRTKALILKHEDLIRKMSLPVTIPLIEGMLSFEATHQPQLKILMDQGKDLLSVIKHIQDIKTQIFQAPLYVEKSKGSLVDALQDLDTLTVQLLTPVLNRLKRNRDLSSNPNLMSQLTQLITQYKVIAEKYEMFLKQVLTPPTRPALPDPLSVAPEQILARLIKTTAIFTALNTEMKAVFHHKEQPILNAKQKKTAWDALVARRKGLKSDVAALVARIDHYRKNTPLHNMQKGMVLQEDQLALQDKAQALLADYKTFAGLGSRQSSPTIGRQILSGEQKLTSLLDRLAFQRAFIGLLLEETSPIDSAVLSRYAQLKHQHDALRLTVKPVLEKMLTLYTKEYYHGPADHISEQITAATSADLIIDLTQLLEEYHIFKSRLAI